MQFRISEQPDGFNSNILLLLSCEQSISNGITEMLLHHSSNDKKKNYSAAGFHVHLYVYTM